MKHKSKDHSYKCFDVSWLWEVDNGVCDEMKELWDSVDSIEDKWNVLRSALCDNAAMILGKACRNSRLVMTA